MKKIPMVQDYIWKYGRDLDYAEVNMVDCSISELESFKTQCNTMLYNTDKAHPGRRVLIDIIKEQRLKCNLELFVRWLKSDLHTATYVFVESMQEFIKNNEVEYPINMIYRWPISICLENIPHEFKDLTLKDILDACMDKLGKFDRSHITKSFILKQKIWLTDKEKSDLFERDEEGVKKNRLTVIKERLRLKSTDKLLISPIGLSYTQLRSMILLKSTKYSALTTEQLVLLRDRILFAFEAEVYFHISQWERLIGEIDETIEFLVK